MAAYYTVPEALVTASSSSSEIDLTWTNTESSPHIEIQRKPSGGTYSTIYTGPSSSESYEDTTCSSNVYYTYRIRYNDGGVLTSDWSSTSSAYSYPAPPSGLAASWEGLTATLTWTNNDTYTYVRVYYKLSSEPTTWTAATTTLTGTLETYDLAIATESTSYDIRICGYNSTSSLASNYNTISSQTSGVIAPTDLILSSATDTSIKCDWTDNSSVEDGYQVYYKLSSADNYTLFETTAADAETSTVTGLTASSEYDFRIRGVDGTNYSSYISGTLTAGTAPDADPVIGTVTVVSSSALTPTWTCTATNEDGFHVYRSEDDSTYEEIGDADEDATSYADTGLSAYTKYYYKVRAYNTQGVSALSDSASETTLIDLDPPTGLSAEALSSTQIKLTFTVNADSATSHYVDRKTTGSYSNIGHTTGGTTATYTDGTCSANTTYTYRIRAYNSDAAEYGYYSAPVTKQTLSVGTSTIRMNESFVALGSKLYIASETPQTNILCRWRSKPLDFSEVDPNDADKIKVVDRVTLDYKDNYADVPVTVSLSNDGGTNWSTDSLTLGDATEIEKSADFYFADGDYCSGKYITLMISSEDSDTSFSWTGITLHYRTMGDYYNPA